MNHPVLLNKSEKEVIDHLKGVKLMDRKTISNGRGRFKITYTQTYKRHDKAIEYLTTAGIIGKDENNILKILRPEYL